MSRSWDGRLSWFSVRRRRAAANGSPGRSMRFMSIAWVTVKLEFSGSGTDSTRRFYLHHLAQFPLVVAELGGGLGHRLDVLHHVFGGLHHHGAGRVVAGPAGPAGNLVELTGVEQAGAYAVVLAQCGEHDGADGHVDSHAQRVRAADNLEQAGLGQ